MDNATPEVNATPVEAPKKRRGMPKGGWPKRNQPAVSVTKSELPKAMDGEALERFVYQATEGEMDDWEGNEEVSPMHVPADIKKNYPDLEFRFTSRFRVDKYGKNYHGWQKFEDKNHPQGVTRGNDMFLTCMPKERAQRYRDRVSERSIENIRSQQAKSLDFEIGKSMSKEEMTSLLKEKGIDAENVQSGIIIGVRPKTKTSIGGKKFVGGGYMRGMGRHEIREHLRKEIEDRKKNRVYSIPK